MHSSVAYISASALLRAVMGCHLDTQWIGPVLYIINPKRERDLNNSSDTGGSFGLGVLWFCGPQLALGKPASLSIGNLTKACRC